MCLLIGTFQLAQFHFHWGNDNGGKGSEHTYHGRQYDAELHFVHYNTECGYDLTSALTNCPDHKAAAVLGVFIEGEGSDNHAWDELIYGLKKITTENTKVEIHPFDMSKLMPHDLNEFYRYDGGLTTPDCDEVVTWTVFKVNKLVLSGAFTLVDTFYGLIPGMRQDFKEAIETFL